MFDTFICNAELQLNTNPMYKQKHKVLNPNDNVATAKLLAGAQDGC